MLGGSRTSISLLPRTFISFANCKVAPPPIERPPAPRRFQQTPLSNLRNVFPSSYRASVSGMATSSRPPPAHVPFNEQLFNHIALPRDVPGREDRNLSNIEAVLLSRLTDATRFLSSYVVLADQQGIQQLVDSLAACQSMHVDRAITKPALLRELRALQSTKTIILHVGAQNCGLLIYKDPRQISPTESRCSILTPAARALITD